jgi:membrane protein insertase Oxa1/YidC/SpoIIIJ
MRTMLTVAVVGLWLMTVPAVADDAITGEMNQLQADIKAEKEAMKADTKTKKAEMKQLKKEHKKNIKAKKREKRTRRIRTG